MAELDAALAHIRMDTPISAWKSNCVEYLNERGIDSDTARHASLCWC